MSTFKKLSDLCLSITRDSTDTDKVIVSDKVEFINNVSLSGDNISDYIIERGTVKSGNLSTENGNIWTWEKWKSGKLVQTYTENVKTSIATSWNSGHAYLSGSGNATEFTNKTYPKVFVDYPHMLISVTPHDTTKDTDPIYSVMAMFGGSKKGTPNTKTTLLPWFLTRPSTAPTDANYRITVRLEGYWK